MRREDGFPTPADRDGGSGHEHYGTVYEGPEERFDTLVPFLRAGLERNERVLACLSETDRDELLAALADEGVDVEARLAADDLAVRSASEFYRPDGTFDVEDVHARLETVVASAGDGDWPRLRMAGELGWLADADVDESTFLEYEARANEVLADADLVGLCLYDADRFGDSTVADVLQTHPYVAVDGGAVRNESYRPPAEFAPGEPPDTDQALSALRTVAAHRDDLAAYRETLRQVTGEQGVPGQEDGGLAALGVDSMRAALSPTATGYWTYRGDDGAFELAAVRVGPGTDVDAEALLASIDDDAWAAFAAGEVRRLSATAPDPIEDGLLAPIGEHGLLAVVDADAGFVDGTVHDVVDATVARLRDAAEAEARRAELNRRDRKLETKRDRLTRLDRANTIVRNVAEAVVDASSAAAIREAVCRELDAVDAAAFVWVGEYDPIESRLVPREWTDDAGDYLDAVDVAVDAEGTEPAVRAAGTESVVAVDDVASDRDEAGWRRRALARGFHAAVGVPLTYDGVIYGALGVYGADAFDDRTRSVLGELGEVVGFAFNALERKRSLLTDEVVELTVRVRDARSPLLGLADRADCRLVYEGAVPRTGEETVGFFTFQGADPATVASVAADSVAVADYRLLDRDDDGGRVQLQLTRPFLATVLAEHGATLRQYRADGDVAEAVVAFPDAVSVRAITDVLERSVDDVDLTSKRRRTHVDSDAGTDPLSSLTERQREVLRAAYHAGYFEQPRRSDGEAVAEALDIASPTFHQHRRVAVNKLLEECFEE